MENLAAKITDSELEVMRTLWEAGDALPVTEIRRSLQAKTDWGSTTIKTLIQRLYAKGVIVQEKRQVYYYRALVTEQAYNEYATRTLIDKLYHGSVKNLVAALVESDGLSDSDIKELRSMFNMEDTDA